MKNKRIHCSNCARKREFRQLKKDSVGVWFICNHCEKTTTSFIGGK